MWNARRKNFLNLVACICSCLLTLLQHHFVWHSRTHRFIKVDCQNDKSHPKLWGRAFSGRWQDFVGCRIFWCETPSTVWNSETLMPRSIWNLLWGFSPDGHPEVPPHNRCWVAHVVESWISSNVQNNPLCETPGGKNFLNLVACTCSCLLTFSHHHSVWHSRNHRFILHKGRLSKW